MSRKKCLSGCTCGKHRKCPTNCTCGRHTVPEERREKIRKYQTGRSKSEEHRRNLSESHRGKTHITTAETCQKISESLRGQFNGREAVGRYLDEDGYWQLTMMYDHPLCKSNSSIAEHRVVLYEKVGPGPHECHWNRVTGCNQLELEWEGRDGVVSDHLDGDNSNNDPDNLVVSCRGCNWRRGRVGNPIDWNGSLIF